MAVTNALAGLAVKDLAAAKEWYARLLERAPDSEPMPEVFEYAFAKGGWLQVFSGDAGRAGHGSMTLAVDNLDAEVARLKTAGIETGEPTRSDYVDTAMVSDPDGNRIVLAQAKSAANRAAG